MPRLSAVVITRSDLTDYALSLGVWEGLSGGDPEVIAVHVRPETFDKK